jgi:predicted Zn-dependent protease
MNGALKYGQSEVLKSIDNFGEFSSSELTADNVLRLIVTHSDETDTVEVAIK